MVAVAAVLLVGGCADHTPDCDPARRPQQAEIAGERALSRSGVCTVVFEGVEVPWLLKITRNDPPLPGLDYTATPSASVHTGQAVYDAFGWEAGQGTDDRYRQPRCDRLPKVFVAKPGTDTGYFCQDVALSCTNGVDEFRWSDPAVMVDGQGRVTFRRR